MKITNAHTNGVIGVTFLAQKINHEIGSYIEHYINESFNFTVKLSNGEIDMTIRDAQDYEARPSSVAFDRFEIVAKTFRKI
jgi:hypothetical protein